ncbi:MAG TPA: alpha-amylase family protein [Opitutaceae bacterium]|jgi:hypothetical protein
MTTTRREFLGVSTLTALGAATGSWTGLAGAEPASPLPWYRRTLRWGQTNINELDPQQYDIGWWREQWRRTRTQGIVVNAGGIVAFYPTEVPLHRRAKFLGDRDLFGELRQAAKEEGIVVFARMDSGGAGDELFREHPDWFARNQSGEPIRTRDLYAPCVNGPYFATHLAAVLREIAARYHPEGFTDNAWSGLGRDHICYCENCRAGFLAAQHLELPVRRDWSDRAFRAWIDWSYACRLRVWDDNNRLTREAGGPDCLWVGMNDGSPYGEAQQFREFREIGRRCEMIMLDDQRRSDDSGFQRNGEVGKLVHGVMGWDKVAAESMAMYQTEPTFRFAAKPAPEARLWMVEGFAGGINPWWHYLGAYGEDRRSYRTPVELCQWHAANERFLTGRRPIATVGLLWSQRSGDFYGRDDWRAQALQPMNGFTQALVKARIPYLPVHIDDVATQARGMRTLIAPNIGALTDEQAATLRNFVNGGGGLVATGYTSLCDHWGDPRPDFALADVLGVNLPAGHRARREEARQRWAAEKSHSYLRLAPELRARIDGPHPAGEPPAVGERHPVLAGFDDTDILSYGGSLEAMTVSPTASVLATFIPPFPITPPEDVWMRTPKTDIPALIVHDRPGHGRVVYLPADLDRRFARDILPDHGRLLANAVRWTAQDDLPLRVEGPGLIDCHLYREPGRILLHLINLTNAGTWRAPTDELIPVGPVRVRVRTDSGLRGENVRLLVAGQSISARSADGWSEWSLPSLREHELAVIA